MSIAIALTLHLIAINVWVGGMFFIVVVFGRVTASMETAQRLTAWHKALSHFFVLIWIALTTLLLSGSWMISMVYGGLRSAPLYIWMMAIIGLLMMIVFVVTFILPYRRFRLALSAHDYARSKRELDTIRLLGKVNMVLGFCVVAIIGVGPHLLVL